MQIFFFARGGEADELKQLEERIRRKFTSLEKLVRLEDLRLNEIRSLDSGTYARWHRTESLGEHLVQVELRNHPIGVGDRR